MKIKHIASLILAITICLSSALGCNNAASNSTVKESKVDLWGCHASVKVLQDKDTSIYEEYRTDAKISLDMARGEYESSQIIISPSVNVPYYNVYASDLTDGKGNKISKENISIYHEGYVKISKNPEKNGVELGMYPDALIPMTAIVDYKENSIKANENQGVYVTVETALDQEVGVYSGSLTIDFQSFTKSVPVKVNVIDLTVSEVAHAKNIFLNDWAYMHGELNTSQEIVDAYTEKLIEYRLAPQRVIEEYSLSTDEGIQTYVDKAAEYLVRPRVSNLDVPMSNTTIDGHSVLDPVIFEKVLKAFIEKSFELNYNLMAKLTYYNRTLDEATFFGMAPEKIKLNAKMFNTTIEKVASALEGDSAVSSENDALRDEMVISIRKIPHVCTFPYSAQYADFDSDEYINANCPMFNYMDSEELRANYCQSEKQPEMWWYGCDVPRYPYVNYHVDHADTLNCRLLSWMQAEYGIVGNLYWATNNYGLIEDYYSEDIMGKSSVNFEGIIFYPGAQYGLDEPVASMRIEAIRDGLEEYELLIALKAKYEELGFSSKDLLSTLSSSLYVGAKVAADLNSFESARKTLLELCQIVDSDANMCVLGTTDNGNGTSSTEVYLKFGYELKNNGVVVNEKRAYADGFIYTVNGTMFETENNLNLTFDVGEKTYSYTQNLGGKVNKIELTDMVNNFSENPATITSEIMDGTTVGLDGQFIKLSVDEIDGEGQIIVLQSSALNAMVNENTKKIVFNVYNPNDYEIKLTMSVKHKKQSIYNAAPAVMLKSNSNNVIEIDMGSVSWRTSGAVEKIRFWFGDGVDGYKDAKLVYLSNAYVYEK